MVKFNFKNIKQTKVWEIQVILSFCCHLSVTFINYGACLLLIVACYTFTGGCDHRKIVPRSISRKLSWWEPPTSPPFLSSPSLQLPSAAVGIFRPLEGKQSPLNLEDCFLRRRPVRRSLTAPHPPITPSDIVCKTPTSAPLHLQWNLGTKFSYNNSYLFWEPKFGNSLGLTKYCELPWRYSKWCCKNILLL